MGAIRNLKQVTDGNRQIFPFSVTSGGWVDCRVLAAATHEAHTVPTGAKSVLISVTGNTFVNVGGTALVHAADVTDGSASILVVNTQPRLFSINGATTIGVIASAIQAVTLEFFS